MGEALVRYINAGSTLASVNMPEVTLGSLTLDEPNHARVIYIHRSVPGVLRRVNTILSKHNVIRQHTVTRGDVAYLMADVTEVNREDVKEISDSLEALDSRILTRVLY